MATNFFYKCLVGFWFLSASQFSYAFCFDKAGARYGIQPELLMSIAQTESSMRPAVESRTHDIGLMGINRSWLPILKKRFGITESHVWEPCTNVMIGAWILASEFSKNGKNWNSVGAYNAACNKLTGLACYQTRQIYATKVWNKWQVLKKSSN